jgi:hypothetical protein
MATATREHNIYNPARRKFSAKQIRAGFGGKRRKANLKHRRNAGGKIITGYGSTVMNRGKKKNGRVIAGYGSTTMNRGKKRKRNAPPASAGRVIAGYGSTTMNRGGKRKNASGQNSKHVVIVNRSHRSAASRRAPKRENPGKEQILSITLPNPGGQRSTMARANRRKNAKHYKAHSAPRKKNPGRHKPKHHAMKHYKRNPSSGGVMGVVTSSVFAGAGLVLSRLATQMVLGASNTGIMGYGGNAVATGLLAWLTHAISKNPRNRDMVVVGGVLGILARMISDFTPYGAWLAKYGVGDYGMGVYLPSNFVVPQRYTNALNSAQVEIPPGWAPTVNVQAAQPAGVGGVYGGGMRALY